uniref:Uncharacterized protein n=1 Tax=Anguilla anguilla TaxID=7936 RepID=A0A0E9PV81_ANGAN
MFLIMNCVANNPQRDIALNNTRCFG